MENQKKNILIWFIIWACLLLVILYSPVGSPYLYNTETYFTPNLGVPFEKGGIQNVRTLNKAGNSYQESSGPDFNTPELGKIASYPVAVSNNSFDKSALLPSQGHSQPVSGQKTANSEGLNIGSVGLYSFKGKSSNNTPSSTGFMALATSLKVSSTYTPFQGVNNYLAGTGATDPGQSDPVDDPIPIGDGWELLILFAVCYILIKKRIIQKQISRS